MDDGSRDDSAPVARAAGAVVVRHLTNLGQGAALETGIRFALALPDVDVRGHLRRRRPARRGGRRRDARAGPSSATSRWCSARGSWAPPRARAAGRRVLLRAAVQFTRRTTGLALTDAHNGLRVLRRDAADARAAPAARDVARQRDPRPCWPAVALSSCEHPVTIRYTDYSRAKGQRGYNALNILFELAVDRMRAAA